MAHTLIGTVTSDKRDKRQGDEKKVSYPRGANRIYEHIFPPKNFFDKIYFGKRIFMTLFLFSA